MRRIEDFSDGDTTFIGPYETESLLCKFCEIERFLECKQLTREEEASNISTQQQNGTLKVSL